jgi:hypothetical protein
MNENLIRKNRRTSNFGRTLRTNMRTKRPLRQSVPRTLRSALDWEAYDVAPNSDPTILAVDRLMGLLPKPGPAELTLCGAGDADGGRCPVPSCLSCAFRSS